MGWDGMGCHGCKRRARLGRRGNYDDEIGNGARSRVLNGITSREMF